MHRNRVLLKSVNSSRMETFKYFLKSVNILWMKTNLCKHFKNENSSFWKSVNISWTETVIFLEKCDHFWHVWRESLNENIAKIFKTEKCHFLKIQTIQSIFQEHSLFCSNLIYEERAAVDCNRKTLNKDIILGPSLPCFLKTMLFDIPYKGKEVVKNSLKLFRAYICLLNSDFVNKSYLTWHSMVSDWSMNYQNT